MLGRSPLVEREDLRAVTGAEGIGEDSGVVGGGVLRIVRNRGLFCNTEPRVHVRNDVLSCLYRRRCASDVRASDREISRGTVNLYRAAVRTLLLAARTRQRGPDEDVDASPAWACL